MSAADAGIGAAIRGWRTQCGLSQRALAARAGVASSTVSRWEAGATLPSLAELRSALRALSVPSADADRALADFHRPRAQRLIAEATESVPGIRPPAGGDLLRALRMRSRWRQAELARAVGLPQSRIARWETGEAWPANHELHAVCRSLGATPEEVAALTIGRFSFAGLLDLSDVDALHQEQWSLLHSPAGGSSDAALKDLRFFALEARLHALLEARYGVGPSRTGAQQQRMERILSWTYARHAQYLSDQGRFPEASSPANRAIQIRARLGADNDNEGWVPALIALVSVEGRENGHVASVPNRYHFQQLLQRLPEIRQASYRAWAMSHLAQAMSQSRSAEHGERAAALSAAALRIVESGAASAGVAEVCLRRRDHADLLTKTGRAADAAAFLPFLSGDSWRTAREQNVRDLLVSAAILIALRDMAGAESALRRAYDLLGESDAPSPVDAPRFASTLSSLRDQTDSLARAAGVR